MKMRIALVLSILASLIWVVALPLWVGRYALSSPTFYRALAAGWRRRGAIHHRTGERTSPSSSRIELVAVVAAVAGKTRGFLRLRTRHGRCRSCAGQEQPLLGPAGRWVKWRRSQPVTPAVAQYLRGPHGDNARDFLWRALPSCEDAAPPACHLSSIPDVHRAALGSTTSVVGWFCR